MELKINAVALPENALTFNYEELKTELLAKADFYATVVYTEDQIKDAKSDRASLNRLKKALNDERIRREKDYMLPFNDFKAKVNEIIGIIDKPCKVIDQQVKAFEDQHKADKLEAIKDLLAETAFPVSLEKVMDDKWLNNSVSLKSIKEALEAKKEQIMNEMAVIDDLPEFSFEAKDFYLKTLDLALTMREVHRLQEQAAAKAKWEAEQAERKQAEAQQIPKQAESAPWEYESPYPATEPVTVAEPVRHWIGFEAFLSPAEATMLGAWFRTKEIKYRAIK